MYGAVNIVKVDFCCKCSHPATRSIVPVQFSRPANPGQRMTIDTRSGKNAGSKHSQPNGDYCGLFVSNCHIAARITRNTHCLTAHSSRDSHVGILPFNKLSPQQTGNVAHKNQVKVATAASLMVYRPMRKAVCMKNGVETR